MEEVILKLKFKSIGVVINPPDLFVEAFQELGFKTAFGKDVQSQYTLVFVKNKVEFLNFLSKQLANIQYDSVLWFAYPKGTSKIKTDINRDILRLTAEGFGMTTVAAISIDATWSALRFRPIDRVGK